MKKGEEVREENCVYSADSYLASLPFYSMARQRVYIQNTETIPLLRMQEPNMRLNRNK